MITHDPCEYIRGIQDILVSDKKRIAFLFGAGTSLAKKNEKTVTIPAIGKMTTQILEQLSSNEKFKIAIEEISEEVGKDKFNIETFLSNIESKKSIIGNGMLNGLNLDEFKMLIKQTKDYIRDIVSVHKRVISENLVKELVHYDFAKWIGKVDRKYPIEIFTTTYDYFFELGLEENNIPYYDGFSGSFRPFFNSESVEDLNFTPEETKLWKIHGSLGWHFEDETSKVFRKDSDEEDIIIYPSSLKYVNSRKQPYTALMDRLTNYLKQPDTILFVLGYSFGDDHINERIITALKTNPLTHVYVFYYDTIWQDDETKSYELNNSSKLTQIAQDNSRISVLGGRSAVIGSQLGKWKLKSKPEKGDLFISSFYDIDKIEDGCTELNMFNGEGELTICDFSKFVCFLQSMICD